MLPSTQTPTVGTVFLRVADQARMTAFYEDAIGLRVHRTEGDTVYLGAGGPDLLALIARPGAPRATRVAGLYHVAFLVPTRRDLGRILHHFIATGTPLQGGADHHVSEAVYLADPEGNGIEIYRDRPRADWLINGRTHITTEALDFAGILGTAQGDDAPWEGLPAGTIVGHIHLRVASIAQTEHFYTQLLGLEIILSMNGMGATFLAYDGYHHHIGANIWASRLPAPDDVLGLDHFILHLPQPRLSAALARLNEAGIAVEQTPAGHRLMDPARNIIVLNAMLNAPPGL